MIVRKRNITTRAIISVASLFIIATLIVPMTTHADDYKDSIEKWRKKHLESFTRTDGYLAFAGLWHIEEGSHTFGSADINDYVFPAKAPELAGKFILHDGVVTLVPSETAGITVDDEPAQEMELGTDRDENTTVMNMGALEFYIISRPGGLYLRLLDHENPAIAAFKGVEHFPVDRKWEIHGRFERYDPPLFIEVPDVMGFVYKEECPGVFVFEVDGKECKLEPMEFYEDLGYFVVFADLTSGIETYGGGRFLYIDPPAEGSDEVIIDFNKAYTAWCAFTKFATCPLPHPFNRLPVRITAGEKFSESAGD